MLSNKIKDLLDLIRFYKPIGFTLLMWPCWFAIATLDNREFNYFFWYAICFLGSFLMRSAGCIINDIIDLEIDRNVERTKLRPLAAKRVSVFEAIIFLIFLLLISLFILIQFNLNAIYIGLLSLPLIFFYPYMKRFTYWPQLFLGIIFNFGILIISMHFFNNLNPLFILLYIGCIFWTLAYDTIYAYQDRMDDINNKIKSTAVLFGGKGKAFVMVFYSFFLMIIGIVGYIKSTSILSIFIIFGFFIAMLFFMNKWDINSKISSDYYFRINNLFGLFCFIYLVVF